MYDTIADRISKSLNVSKGVAETIIEKAATGGEIKIGFSEEQWLTERFLPNCVFIDETGYAEMCIDALKILGSTAATDYGSSRQRDMGQLWADMTRGYLGEYAFKIFLKEKFGISAELGHEQGELSQYLSTDIHRIKRENGEWASPRINISIKATKWNGIWFDIPGDQFNHSDVHILVKVGVGRDHLFAFFKKISVFKDKILKKGKEIGLLSENEADTLFDRLPAFSTVPAYICGFAERNAEYPELPYRGKAGRKNYTITEWNGRMASGDLGKIKEREHITGSIKFEGIGNFAHDSGYLFNTGNLKWSKADWERIIARF
jgi:hypothetical protein